jgi:hypothetical protein
VWQYIINKYDDIEQFLNEQCICIFQQCYIGNFFDIIFDG